MDQTVKSVRLKKWTWIIQEATSSGLTRTAIWSKRKKEVENCFFGKLG